MGDQRPLAVAAVTLLLAVLLAGSSIAQEGSGAAGLGGTSESALAEPKHLDIFEIIRSKIQDEEALIQQRVAWFLTANGFLFAAFGALVARWKDTDVLTPVVVRAVHTLPAVGIFLALATGSALLAAKLAMEGAISEWARLAPVAKDLFPEPRSVGNHLWLGGLSSGGLCVGLGLIWLWLGLKAWEGKE